MTDTLSPSPSDEVASDGRRPVPDALLTGAMLVVAAVIAMFCAITLASVGLDRATFALAVGALAGGALAFTAITRFVAFILVLVVLRGTLDGLKLTGVGGSAITEPGVMVGGVLLVACVLWLLAQRSGGLLVPLSKTSRWMVALAAVAVIGVPAAGDRAAAAEAALRVITSVLTFIVFEQLLATRPKAIRGLLVAAMFSIIVPAFVGFRQLTGAADFEEADLDRIRGTFVHPNALASYAVIIALVAFGLAQLRHPRVKVIAWSVFALASMLLLFSYGRAAWGGMLVGIGYLLWRIRPQLVLILVAGILAAPLLIPSIGERLSDLGSSPTAQEIGDGNANSFAWRVEYWGEILPFWAERPILGIGLDQVPTRTTAELQPHSVVVQSIVEMGTVGLVVMLGLVIAVAGDLRRARSRARTEFDRWMAFAATAAAIAFGLQMITENLLTQVAIHLYLWIPLAFATSLTRRTSQAGIELTGVSDEPAERSESTSA